MHDKKEREQGRNMEEEEEGKREKDEGEKTWEGWAGRRQKVREKSEGRGDDSERG